MSSGDQDDDLNPNTMLLPSYQEHDRSSPTPLQEQEPHSPNQHYIPSIQSTVLIRLLPSQGLSFQLWPAATTLVSLIDRHRSSTTISTLITPPPPPHRLRILELGSGTGLVGISAAAILSADVTLTDLPHVVPNLQFNADLNSALYAAHGGTVAVASLRWGESDDVEVIGGGWDLILASDVVYHDHLYEPLLKTLRLLLERDERSVFVMAHLKRWKKESVFFKKAKKLFQVEIIHSDAPSQGSRVGVVVYRFVAKHQILKNQQSSQAEHV